MGIFSPVADPPSGFLARMVDGPPEEAHFAIDLHVDLVEMPTPMRGLAHVLNSFPPDLAGEHRAEPVSPAPHGLLANVDPALGRASIAQSTRLTQFHKPQTAPSIEGR